MLSRAFIIVCLYLCLFVCSSCSTPVTVQTCGALIQTEDENLKNEDFVGALLDCNKAIGRNPRDAEAWMNRGIVLSCLGDTAGALNNYNRALTLKPKMALAYLNRGSTYVKMGDLVKAIDDFTTCIRLAPRNSHAYYNRGSAFQNQGDLDRALADFNQAISLDPKFAAPYLNRGAAKLSKDEPVDAIADFSRVLELAPQFAAKAYVNRGKAYRAVGNPTEAMADFNRAIVADPSAGEGYGQRANLNVQLGKFDDAIADFSKGLKLDPKVKYPRFFHALTLLRLQRDVRAAGLAAVVPKWKQEWAKEVGRYLLGELAEADFMALARQGDEKSVREHSCEAFYYIGMMHLIANETEVARGHFEKCLSTNVKNFVEYSFARAELARLGEKR